MPIYAYRCESCGHQQDVLQKMSDVPLTVCTACAAAAFKKQVTAAGFQLKGSGWYVTDFRNNGAAPAKSGKESGKDDGAGQAGKSADASAPAAGANAPASPAGAPVAAPAAAPSAATSGGSSGGGLASST